MKSLNKLTTVLTLALSCAAAHSAPIFRIGTPDGRAAEFNDFGQDFNSTRYFIPYGTDPYAATRKFFNKPFVFEVGKNRDADFPFVQPMRTCEWADSAYRRPLPDDYMYSGWAMLYRDYKGVKYPPLTIKFKLDSAPQKDLYLKLGFADKSPFAINDQSMEICVNGKETLKT